MDSFFGYERSDGRVGVRNHVLVLSTVGCANGTVAKIAANADGAIGLPNVKGCGQIGTGIEIMMRALANLPQNPNVYGTILVGLGCETTRPYELAAGIREICPKPLEVLTIQDAGGTSRAIDRGIGMAREMVEQASRVKRAEAPVSKLTLATNCGGSDATSGIAANPALGSCSDRLIARGATVMLGETTELIGTEHMLGARARDRKTAERIRLIIGDLERRFIDGGIDVCGANPTPGNIKGGLSTLEEKALGSMQKGGTSPINEVISYASIPREAGLVIMDTPGYDIESVSGMIAGGAQVCAFTSGRGTPVGCALAPMIKITGNRATYESMADNIDLDASPVIDGTCSITEMGAIIFDHLIKVCSGEQTKAEQLGFQDFAIYHNQELWCSCDLS